MKSTCLKYLILLASTGYLEAADLSSSGDWVQGISAADLVAGAGSNLQPIFESVPGATVLSIANAPGSWSLRVRQSGSGGSGNVTIYVRRVSAGSGSGSIAGGTAYQALSGSDAELFSGSLPRSGVTLQYKLTGLSAGVPPSTYLSSIIFTVQ